jgi:putative endonuclease
MFFVYILESEKNGRFYVGYSEDPQRRLADHNVGKVISTRNHRPWIKVFEETFNTETEAIRREREIKSKKSRTFLLKLIGRHRSKIGPLKVVRVQLPACPEHRGPGYSLNAKKINELISL